MIRKVYELAPLICPSCGGKMSIVSFIEDQWSYRQDHRQLRTDLWSRTAASAS